MSNRRQRRLDHVKTQKGKIGKGFPKPEEARQGHSVVKYIEGKGLYEFTHFNNQWYNKKLEESTQIDLTTSGKISTSNLVIEEGGTLDVSRNNSVIGIKAEQIENTPYAGTVTPSYMGAIGNLKFTRPTTVDGQIGYTTDNNSVSGISINSDVLVGSGSADGLIQSRGDYDLILQTGDENATGTIKIINGASGDIELHPNANGYVNMHDGTLKVYSTISKHTSSASNRVLVSDNGIIKYRQADEIVADGGGGTGTVTTSGSSNSAGEIVMFSGSTAITSAETTESQLAGLKFTDTNESGGSSGFCNFQLICTASPDDRTSLIAAPDGALQFWGIEGGSTSANTMTFDPKAGFLTLTTMGLDITDATDASDISGDTGALRCEGGASIAKKVYSGYGFYTEGIIDVDYDIDNTTAATNTPALKIDSDRVGAVTSGTDTNTGIDLDLNVTGAGTSGTPTINTTGIDIDVVGDNAGGGTSGNTGLDINVSNADRNVGILLNVTDGGGNSDIKIVSSANILDYFTITVGAEGATTIATNDADATVAHLTMQPDGDLILDPASQKVIINATDYLFFDGGTNTYIYESGTNILDFMVGAAQMLRLNRDSNVIDLKSDNIRLADLDGSTYSGADATNLQTKAQIDAAIGDSIKVEVAEVTISEAEMNNLHSTEKTLIAARGANKTIIPIKIVAFAERDASTSQANNVAMYFSSTASTSGGNYWGYIKGFMRLESGDRVISWFTSVGDNIQSLTGGENQPLSAKMNGAITSGSIDSCKLIIQFYVYDSS